MQENIDVVAVGSMKEDVFCARVAECLNLSIFSLIALSFSM